MAQTDSEDPQLTALLRGYLHRLEQAFESTILGAQSQGTADGEASARDVACQLVALTQGMALLGRVSDTKTQQRCIVRAALRGLRP
jgi:hypothetical protein